MPDLGTDLGRIAAIVLPLASKKSVILDTQVEESSQAAFRCSGRCEATRSVGHC